MSLADELLADLESDGEEIVVKEEEEQFSSVVSEETGYPENNTRGEPGPQYSVKQEHDSTDTVPDHSNNGFQTKAQTAMELAQNIQMHGVPIRRLAHVMRSVDPILAKIRQTSVYSSDETYKLLMEANKYSVEIDNELVLVHRFTLENYSKRFHELGSLVVNPVTYAKVVKIIGNNVDQINSQSDKKQLVDQIKSIVGGPTMMTISMSALNSKGQALSQEELNQVVEACTLIETLDSAKRDVTAFVSQRLVQFAPNLVQIVDSQTAAQLLALAGGLDKLATTPSANIPALGSNKSMALGFGYSTLRQQGFLYHSHIIQQTPPDKRKQAMRIVSAKIVLAARVDCMAGTTDQSSQVADGSAGRKWRQEIQDKIHKLSEPPQIVRTKALKIPDDKPSKKRGGRRIRKMKEQWMQTDLMKARNRLEFGANAEQELTGVLDQSLGMGMAAGASSKGIRKIAVDNRTRAKMSKGMHSRLEMINRTTRNMETQGMASSLAYTGMQGGLELVDPGRMSKQALENVTKTGWFKPSLEPSGQDKNQKVQKG